MVSEESREIRASVRPLSLDIFVPNCVGNLMGEDLSKLLDYIKTAKVELEDGYLRIESDNIHSLLIHLQSRLDTGRLVDDYVTIVEENPEDENYAGKLFIVVNTEADEEGVWLLDAREAIDFICELLDISPSRLKELLIKAQAKDILPTLAKWMDGR